MFVFFYSITFSIHSVFPKIAQVLITIQKRVGIVPVSTVLIVFINVNLLL